MITLKSKAAQDLDVPKEFAAHVLSIVGKTVGERGVITVEELPGAIGKLEAAAQEAKQRSAEHAGHFHEGAADHSYPHEEAPSVAQRLAPFLMMLREAHAQSVPVYWGF